MRKMLLIMVAALAFVACGNDAPADKVAGTYGCKATLYTRYQKGSQWRDTSYTVATGNTASVSRIDDKTVKVSLVSDTWGTAEFPVVKLNDLNYMSNLSGSGTYVRDNSTYDVSVSGSINYDSKAVAITFKVPDYPYSAGRYVISFTNTSYN